MVINYPVCKSEFLKRKPWHSSLNLWDYEEDSEDLLFGQKW